MFSNQVNSRASQALLLVLGLLLLSGCTKNQDDIDLPIFSALGGDFTLPSTVAESLTLSDYKGKVVLINFGYTSCPDICPMVLARIAQLSKQLETEFAINAQQLQIFFISVDPERDTVEQLKEYLAFFNPDFIGIRGSAEQTQELAKKYAVFYEKQPEDNIGYQVAHTDNIFLMDKRGRLRATYGKTTKDEKLIKDIVSLAKADF